jgi:hypothetical protein
MKIHSKQLQTYLGDSGMKNIKILKKRGTAKRVASGIW